MKKQKAAVLGVTAVLTVAGLAFAAIPANAEAPVSPGGYTFAGSDTIQDVMDALTNGTTVTGVPVQVKSSGVFNASYDAFPNSGPGSYIQTHSPSSASDPTYFLRPSGSGDGINSMIASNNLLGTTTWTKNTVPYNVKGQIDVARSSSSPKTVLTSTADANSIDFIPFARDAVTYAYVEGSSWTQAQKDAFASLDQPTLKSIYQGAITDVSGVSPRPLLPQSTSGTRKFFLGSSASQGIGIGNNTDPAGLGAGDNNFQENTAFGVLTVPGEIIPFSAASWIAQNNGAIPFNSIGAANTALAGNGTVKLGDPLGTATPVFGTTTTAGKLTPLAGYYSDSRWGRNTFLVVPKGKYDTDTKLHALLDPTVTNASSLTGFGSAPTSPGAVKRAFGFLAPTNGTTIVPALAESY